MSKSLKVLCIGNSFSDDMRQYAREIATSLGFNDLIIGNLYIGGCSLYTHLRNSKTTNKAYRFYVSDNSDWVDYDESLINGIKYTDWDVITLQQASHYSGIEDTYAANLIDLIDYVKVNATNKNVKLYWHMTWAYDFDSLHPNFFWYKNNTTEMYKCILNTVKYQVCCNPNFAGIIKNGIAMENMRNNFGYKHMTRDGFHASNPLGFYVLGTNFISTITGIDVMKITWKPDNITIEQAEQIKSAVKDAQNTEI